MLDGSSRHITCRWRVGKPCSHLDKSTSWAPKAMSPSGSYPSTISGVLYDTCTMWYSRNNIIFSAMNHMTTFPPSMEENICKQMRHSRNIIFVAFHYSYDIPFTHLISNLTSVMSAGLLPSFPKYTHLLNFNFSAFCSLFSLCHIVNCLIGVSFEFFCKRF